MGTIRRNDQEQADSLKIIFGDVVLGVRGEGFEYLFSYPIGGMESLVVNGREWLYRAPKPTFWRATTDNDRGCGFSRRSAMWMGTDMFMETRAIRVWVDGSELTGFMAPGNNRFAGEVTAEEIKVCFTYVTATVPETEVEAAYTVGKSGRIQVDVHYYGKRGCRSCRYSECAFLCRQKQMDIVIRVCQGRLIRIGWQAVSKVTGRWRDCR